MGKTERTVAVGLAELAVTTPEAGAKLVGKGRDVSVAVAMREADAPAAEALTAEAANVTPTAAHSCCPHAINCCSPD